MCLNCCPTAASQHGAGLWAELIRWRRLCLSVRWVLLTRSSNLPWPESWPWPPQYYVYPFYTALRDSDPVLQASLCRSECGMCAKYEVLSPLSRCSFPSPESFLLIAVFAIRNIYIFPHQPPVQHLPCKEKCYEELEAWYKADSVPCPDLRAELHSCNYCRSSPDTNPRHCNPIIQISPCSKCSLIVAFSQS